MSIIHSSKDFIEILLKSLLVAVGVMILIFLIIIILCNSCY
jgi:hypothetical protein